MSNWNIEKAKKNITKEDVERNIKKLEGGEQLDLPLHFFPGNFKQIIRGRHHTFKEVEYDKEYRKKNRIKISTQKLFAIYEQGKTIKNTMDEKVESCLWFLYYYTKLKQKEVKEK